MVMNNFILASSLIAFAAGCSDEADIGIDSTPMTCDGTRIATVDGEVSQQGKDYSFGDNVYGSVIAGTTDSPTTLTLSGGGTDIDPNTRLMLRFQFQCGSTERASYDVAGEIDQNNCPLTVQSAFIGGAEQVLSASEGTLILDESSNGLAGRFRVDFGDNGALGGTFSTPWQ
jgi:hypothetical protein